MPFLPNLNTDLSSETPSKQFPDDITSQNTQACTFSASILLNKPQLYSKTQVQIPETLKLNPQKHNSQNRQVPTSLPSLSIVLLSAHTETQPSIRNLTSMLRTSLLHAKRHPIPTSLPQFSTYCINKPPRSHFNDNLTDSASLSLSWQTLSAPKPSHSISLPLSLSFWVWTLNGDLTIVVKTVYNHFNRGQSLTSQDHRRLPVNQTGYRRWQATEKKNLRMGSGEKNKEINKKEKEETMRFINKGGTDREGTNGVSAVMRVVEEALDWQVTACVLTVAGKLFCFYWEVALSWYWRAGLDGCQGVYGRRI